MRLPCQAELPTQSGVQPVAGEQPTRPRTSWYRDATVVLVHGFDPLPDDVDAQLSRSHSQGPMQLRAAHAQAGTGPEGVLDAVLPFDVPNAGEGTTVWIHSEPIQGQHSGGHQSLTAGLVHRYCARFVDNDRQARQPSLHCCGQPHRSAAGNQHVDLGH
jgi:hypothetical protein